MAAAGPHAAHGTGDAAAALAAKLRHFEQQQQQQQRAAAAVEEATAALSLGTLFELCSKGYAALCGDDHTAVRSRTSASSASPSAAAADSLAPPRVAVAGGDGMPPTAAAATAEGSHPPLLLARLQRCWRAAQAAGVFSPNEALEDVATPDMCLFLLPSMTADVQLHVHGTLLEQAPGEAR